MRTHMKYQHYEQRFLENLANEFNIHCIPEEDKSLLIRIWRRKGNHPDIFVIGKSVNTINFNDGSNFIYIQNGKYHHSLENIASNQLFIALRTENRETAVGAPVYTVYVSQK